MSRPPTDGEGDGSAPPLLQVENLRTYLYTRWGTVRAVDGVSFTLHRGGSLGLVGESGSGKSMTCLSILRLLPKGGQIAGGSVHFAGEDLLAKSERDMRSIRGRRISMILQDPMTSLNPVFSVGSQVAEPLRLHQGLRGQAARARALEALRLLDIPAPEHRLRDYPHQLSGGMRQRVLGAIALSCGPELIIADEPTTSLDVTVQAQYLQLLRRIQHEQRVAIIFVTHDLGIVARMCERVAVMYAGRIVESGPVREVFRRPAHPYTRALIASIPDPERNCTRLQSIEGQPPALHEPLSPCAFAPRCPIAEAKCMEQAPPEMQITPGHVARCWKPEAP